MDVDVDMDVAVAVGHRQKPPGQPTLAARH